MTFNNRIKSSGAKIFFLAFLMIGTCSAAINNPTGNINFYPDANNAYFMQLNSTGLGIGGVASSNLHVHGNAMISREIHIGGTTTGGSNLNINGTISFSPVQITSSNTLDNGLIFIVDPSSDNIIITLPYAGNVTGREYYLKKINHANSVIVKGGGNLIDSVESIEMNHYANLGLPRLCVISDGHQWWKLNSAYTYDIVASDNLIRWYKLDETSGTKALEQSGNNTKGSLINGLDFSTKSITGKINKALSFDGNNDGIDLDDIDIPSNQKFSIALWMNTTGSQPGTDGQGYLVSKSQYTSDSVYLLNISSSNLFSCAINGTFANSLSTVNDGLWRHCVLTIDGTTMSNYLNGVLQSTAVFVHESPNNNNVRIGATATFASYRAFSGNIDDVRFYNKTLSASEVSALYSSADGN